MPCRLATLLLLALLLPSPARAQEGPPDLDRARADWQAVLDRYLVEGGVDYDRLVADDPAELRRYLAWLEAARPGRWSVAEQRAFWINAYNARTIAGVLRHWPIESVRDVGLLGGRIRGFFGRREHPVAGRPRTLDEIEKEILLEPPLFDPRVHFAINCASKGCPRLRPEPYAGTSLDTQLDFQARTYLNGPTGHRLDRDQRTLYLTRIFDWYRDDFTRVAESVRGYAARYLTGAAADAAEDPDWTLEFLEYDWSLNAAP
ncbi:MAG: DUF547 domain-containing protein [Gemmatimonadota bacterium]|nr:DUF547 domain-containing protein [Gemmatimonadota bacterium]